MIPDDFAQRVIDREGDPGRAWIAALPGLMDELLQRWGCTPTTAPIGGGVGIIVRVRRRDGSPAVLKISLAHPGNRYEAHALAAWGGRGAVLLYERDDARFAMLLEQAEWQTLEDLGDIDQATAAIGRLARRLAVPAPPELPRLSDQADEWEQTLLGDADKLGHPLSGRALGAAVATVQELGRYQPDTMVHGDLHFGNVVRTHREEWLVIDPKGLAGDLAFDALRVLVRGAETLLAADNLETELRRRLAIFADAAEIERERATRWAQLDAVKGAHHSRSVDDPAWITKTYEQIAEILA